MKIHNINLNTHINEKLFHLAIGNFDGVHLGHQQIITSLVKYAKKNNKPSAILSFDPHPRQFFSRELDCYQIISEFKKQELLKSLQIKHYFALCFDESISNLSPRDFIKLIIVDKLKVEKLIVGYDFHFGKNREGNIDLLKDFSTMHGFLLEVVEPIGENKNMSIYSSTKIRENIRIGKIDKANLMLGRNWSMQGQVIHGNKKAREINFPTANILPHDQIYPAKGVYAINALLNNKIVNGIANFGERPTINGSKLLLEAHLFNFNEDIYGKDLTVEFLTFIRGEKKFDSFALLAQQIKQDIETVKSYHMNK